MLPRYALEFDEELDAIASLELLAEYLPRVLTVPYAWKWVILSLHSALQGFMVLSLQGTHFLNVLSKESAEEWSEHYEKGEPPTHSVWLDAFMRLYGKICSDAMLLNINSRPFLPTSRHNDAVSKLNAHRNHFAHFVPAMALLDMRVWARLVCDVIPIVEFLAFQSKNVLFDEPGVEERVAGLCAIAKAEASALLQYYGA